VSKQGRWPPPAAISSRGKWAGLTTGGCLVVTGLAFVVFSFDELTCRVAEGGCDVIVGVGGVVSLVALGVTAAGVIIVRKVWARPISESGEDGWSLGLGVLFAVGAAIAVTRLPTHTCPRGFLLDTVFELCVRGGERIPTDSHLIEKLLLTLVAVVLGVVVARARWIPSSVATVVAATAWIGGIGLLLIDTMAREFLPG
jgi:hypothetical protein